MWFDDKPTPLVFTSERARTAAAVIVSVRDAGDEPKVELLASSHDLDATVEDDRASGRWRHSVDGAVITSPPVFGPPRPPGPPANLEGLAAEVDPDTPRDGEVVFELTPTFYFDHAGRVPELRGRVIAQSANRVLVALTPPEVDDLLSDARHYTDSGIAGDMGAGYVGLRSSARATVRRVERRLAQASREGAAR